MFWILIYSAVALILSFGLYIGFTFSYMGKKKDDDSSVERADEVELDKTGNAFRRYLRSLKEEHERIDAVSMLGYDPASPELSSLKALAPMKQKSGCVFAKRALAWGAPDWSENLSLEQNAMRIAPALKLFMTAAKGLALDAFVVEMKGAKYSKDLKSFGRAVYFLLKALCDLEENCGCMRRSYIGKYGWWFEYCHDFVFLTTFAPFYPVTHSRHQYDAPSDSCFVLFQPEFSFARRNISCGHEPTEWQNPKSERDTVRVNFLSKNQNYVKRSCDPVNDAFVRQLAITQRPKSMPLFGFNVQSAANLKKEVDATNDDDDDNNNKHDVAHDDEAPENQAYGPTSWQIVREIENDGIQSYYEWWVQKGQTFDEH